MDTHPDAAALSPNLYKTPQQAMAPYVEQDLES